MANKHRGEMKISLGGQDYNTRLNFDSIARIEGTTGQSVIRLAQSIGDTSIGLQQLSIVLHAAIKGGGNDVTEKDVNKIIWEAGIVAAMGAAGEVLSNALIGGQDEGKDEAEEA